MRAANSTGPRTPERHGNDLRTSERSAYGTSVASPQLLQEPLWAREMRTGLELSERARYPSCVPWIHGEGRLGLRQAGLPHLALSEGEEVLEAALEQEEERRVGVMEACQDAIMESATQVLEERKRSMADLIHEMLLSVPEEEEDQSEILRNIAAALLQEVRGGGRSRVIEDEGVTLHYLYRTLTLMRHTLGERERCLQQAEVLDQLLTSIWRRGVQNQLVQQAREKQPAGGGTLPDPVGGEPGIPDTASARGGAAEDIGGGGILHYDHQS